MRATQKEVKARRAKVAKLTAQKKTNAEIAKALGISVTTVRRDKTALKTETAPARTSKKSVASTKKPAKKASGSDKSETGVIESARKASEKIHHDASKLTPEEEKLYDELSKTSADSKPAQPVASAPTDPDMVTRWGLLQKGFTEDEVDSFGLPKASGTAASTDANDAVTSDELPVTPAPAPSANANSDTWWRHHSYPELTEAQKKDQEYQDNKFLTMCLAVITVLSLVVAIAGLLS